MRRHTVQVLSPKDSSKVHLYNDTVSPSDHMHGMAYNTVRVQQLNPASKLLITCSDSAECREARISSTEN